MSSSGVIIVVGNNGVAEVEIIRDIDLSLDSEDAGIILPIREAGSEGRENFPRDRLESCEDNGVRGRGSC